MALISDQGRRLLSVSASVKNITHPETHAPAGSRSGNVETACAQALADSKIKDAGEGRAGAVLLRIAATAVLQAGVVFVIAFVKTINRKFAESSPPFLFNPLFLL